MKKDTEEPSDYIDTPGDDKAEATSADVTTENETSVETGTETDEEDFSVEEKTLRILSIDAEKRNRHICDMEIENQKDLGAEIILEKIGLLNN